MRCCSYTLLMPYNLAQLSESCNGYHGQSTDLQILHYSYAVLGFVSMKAEVWTFPDMSGLVDQFGPCVWNH
ncbi:hypothetical protein T4B_9564 [Trichinella pseudospiralis]|uniref:Uncharacterized protein n=1 Tax=Trichinella pseudospiralis TaxID=6337 RepID=A0A0V1IFQ7_TRIPS|nr:hypothetical protein T4B_9564 [Trichinella pseudospiralis]KRZ27589.1 hypothetical protein T4C_3522 [Trichinella pseudospiralis]